MKKIWKVILVIAVILVIGAGSSAYYFFKVKTYNVADKKVDKIINGKYHIDLPGQTVPGNQSGANSAAKNNSDSKSNSASNNGQSTSANGTKSGTSAGNNGSNQTPPGIFTAETIKEKYQPTFESLQSQANGKINSLISTAIAEYKSKKANGENISFAYFYQKYNAAGGKLENQTDATFNYIYLALQKDLKNNNFDPAEAKSFKTTYENEKKQRESSLLQKAKAALF